VALPRAGVAADVAPATVLGAVPARDAVRAIGAAPALVEAPPRTVAPARVAGPALAVVPVRVEVPVLAAVAVREVLPLRPDASARVAGPGFDATADFAVVVLRRGALVTPSLLNTLRSDVFIRGASDSPW